MDLQEFADMTTNMLNRMRGLMPPTEGAGDPTGEGFSREHSVRDPGLRVMTGIVSDVCPPLNAFRVSIPNSTTRICSVLSLTGGTMHFGSCFSVGDQVLVVGAYGSSYGTILGKIAEASRYQDVDPRSFVTLSQNFKQTSFQKSFFEMLGGKENETVPLWTYGAPIQTTNLGELFIGAVAGPKIFIDPFMAYLSVNDATGIWTFRDDSMLRIAGINYQKITSGSYEEELNDNGECTLYRGYCLNSWESLGYYTKPKEDILKDEKDWEDSDEPKSFIEPKEKNAKPFHRIIELGGYLGKGKQTIVLAPPESGEVGKYGSKEDNQLALSRIVQNTDGFIGIESAKGISIVKSKAIPSIQRLWLPENDADGDNKDNYKFDHKDYEPVSEPELTAEKRDEAMQSAMAAQDYFVYTMQYKSLVQLLRHKKDWFIPEFNDVKKGSFDLSTAINSLNNKYVMELPESYTLEIDGKAQKYYPVEAGIHLLPEGGVVIYDGYGGEIRMAGGQITISAPGGINIHSGTDTQIWAGRNLSVRAKDSIVQSATKGSVHVKAEKNLELLGGNAGGTSGVVIESKGQGSMDFSADGDDAKIGGIVMKCAQGTISTVAGTLYMGALEQGAGIMLDSAQGRRGIYTASQTKEDYVASRYAINFGNFKSGNIEKVYESTKDMHTIPCSTYIAGTTEILDNVLIDGAIQCDQHIYTKQAENNPMVSPLTGKAAASFDKIIRQADTYVTDTAINTSKTQYTSGIKPSFYASEKPGNENVIKRSGFSYRTDEQMNLGDFCVYADRWQTICTSGTPWEETKVVTFNETGEYPYPGKNFFETQNCYVMQTLVFCDGSDVAEHKSGDEIDDKYLNPEYNKPQLKSLNEYRSMG